MFAKKRESSQNNTGQSFARSRFIGNPCSSNKKMELPEKEKIAEAISSDAELLESYSLVLPEEERAEFLVMIPEEKEKKFLKPWTCLFPDTCISLL